MTGANDQGPEETPAPGPADGPGGQVPDAEPFVVPDDISGIDNLLEEGGPLEPQDIIDAGDAVPEPVDPLEAARQEAAERTADLQRLQAEFLNYKRRVDRDRDLVRENAVFAVLTPMLDVLDNIDRAREAGEVEGGFKSVAEQLDRIVNGLGLVRYGVPGDAFDPALHEALSHVGTSAEVSVQTCQLIAKAGYKIGDRVVRAAQVLVVDPEEA
ncbi:MAG: nucleotide exchange factor GrpE [Propionibacteriales bacterium]|nr:nucleotide exchange factor GrpE [Propionibacteriales bacterium]